MATGIGKLRRKDQLDFIMQGATPTAPGPTAWIAWHTGDPLDDGSAANECANANAYARTPFNLGSTNWNAATTPSNDAPSIVTNKVAIVSATPTGAAWGTVTWFSIRLSSTIGETTGSNFVARGTVSPGQVTVAGTPITIPIGAASLSANSS
jgi:hypothetical protein